MSALNCFVTPHAVHIFTDGGHYDLDTISVRGIGNKVVPLPHYNAALAGIGLTFIPGALAMTMLTRSFGGFDGLIAAFPSFVRQSVETMRKYPGYPSDWGQFELIVLGWSEAQNGPVAYHLSGYAKGDQPAWHFQEVTRFRAPNDPSFREVEFDPENAAEFGLALMEEQRNTPFAVPTARPLPPGLGPMRYRVVHGFCQHTSIDRAGIHMRVLKHWRET
jgi:hypothetical protein